MRASSVALAIALATVAACHEHPKPSASAPLPATSAKIAVAKETLLEGGDDVVGTVRPHDVTSLSPSVMGTIRAIRASLGSKVRAGDVVVELLAGEIDASARKADAMYAQASLAVARARDLRTHDTISQSELDAAEAQFRVADAARAEARTMSGYTAIRAPFAGVVTAKLANVGDLAVPGHPLLTIEDPTTLRLEATVPEHAAGAIVVGQSLPVRIDAISSDLEGRVAEVSPAADPVSRTVLVKVELPPTPALRTGMFGRLRTKSSATKMLAVPKSALVRRGQLEVVYVVDAGGAARLRLVKSGRATSGGVEILAGLDQGERVVASDASRVLEGQPITETP